MIFDLQKANVWKRISSFIFDAIITSILMVGFAFLISKIVRYDDYNNQLNEYYAEYEELYGVSFTLTSDEFAQLSDEDLVIFQEAYDAFNADEEAMKAYDTVINLTMIITVLAIFLAIFGLEFVIPLILKNGQTMGKKIFGLGVVKNNGVRINSIALFVRSVLGKCVLETMIPVFIALLIYFANLGIIGTGLIVIFLLIQITLFIVTRYHTLIHDFLSYTTVVDIDSQLIFESEETMLAYKNKLHSEKVSKSN